MTDNELNNAAALKVMGWHRTIDFWCDSDGVAQSFAPSFNPRSRIEHAWLLVEKIKGMNLTVKGNFATQLRLLWNAIPSGERFPIEEITWLTPAHLTQAAVLACEKEGK